MNDDLMFDYLLQMGAMRPEQEELRKKQAMIDMLRKQSMTPMEGQMVGKHYVAPGIGNALAQLGTAYMASQAQGGLDTKSSAFNQKQREALEEMRRRRRAGMGGGMGTPVGGYNDPYSNVPTYGNEA